MGQSRKPKASAKVTRIVRKEIDGKIVGGYIEVVVKVGSSWKRLFFKLEE